MLAPLFLHFLRVFTVYKLLAHIILNIIGKVKDKETKKPDKIRVSPCLRGCSVMRLRIDIFALSAAGVLPFGLHAIYMHFSCIIGAYFGA